jgi:hypothetical protein
VIQFHTPPPYVVTLDKGGPTTDYFAADINRDGLAAILGGRKTRGRSVANSEPKMQFGFHEARAANGPLTCADKGLDLPAVDTLLEAILPECTASKHKLLSIKLKAPAWFQVDRRKGEHEYEKQTHVVLNVCIGDLHRSAGLRRNSAYGKPRATAHCRL